MRCLILINSTILHNKMSRVLKEYYGVYPSSLFLCADDINSMHFVLTLKKTDSYNIEELVKLLRHCGAEVSFCIKDATEYSAVIADHEDPVEPYIGPVFNIDFIRRSLKELRCLDIADFRQKRTRHVAAAEPEKCMEVVYLRMHTWSSVIAKSTRRCGQMVSSSHAVDVPEKEVSECESDDQTQPKASSSCRSTNNILKKGKPGCIKNNQAQHHASSTWLSKNYVPCEEKSYSEMDEQTLPKASSNSRHRNNKRDKEESESEMEELALPQASSNFRHRNNKRDKEESESEMEELALPQASSNFRHRNNKRDKEESESEMEELALPQASSNSRHRNNKRDKEESESEVEELALPQASSNFRHRNNKRDQEESESEMEELPLPLASSNFRHRNNKRDKEESESEMEELPLPLASSTLRYRNNEPEKKVSDIKMDKQTLPKASLFPKSNTTERSKRDSEMDCQPSSKTSTAHCIKPAPINKRTRVPYTHEERCTILKYIVQNNAHSKVKGREFWCVMEKRKLLPIRTWQSMKEHFLKKIVVDLDCYPFLTKSDKMKLKTAGL